MHQASARRTIPVFDLRGFTEHHSKGRDTVPAAARDALDPSYAILKCVQHNLRGPQQYPLIPGHSANSVGGPENAALQSFHGAHRRAVLRMAYA
jgi:hypothetical protein